MSESEAKNNSITPPASLTDKYQFIRLIGEGANGKTWLAHNLLTSKEVAIKELKNIHNFKQIELFIREAEILSSLNVRSVPKVYENFILDNGQCYLVEEYIPYNSLQSLLDDGYIFSESETFAIMQEVVDIVVALQEYAPPIIHRDIKPSNILYNKISNNQIEVFLIDFGAVTHPTKHNSGSTIAGTFGYMPPELYYGDADIRSDYYSIGATAVHLLTGESPYTMQQNNEADSSKDGHVSFKLDYKKRLPKSVSKSMRRLLDSLLATKIENRPSDATALKQAMKDYTDGAFMSTLGLLFKKCLMLIHTKRKYTEWKKITGRIELILPEKRLRHGYVPVEYTYKIKDKLYSGKYLIYPDSALYDIKLSTKQTKEMENIITLEYLVNEPTYSVPIPSTLVVSEDNYNLLMGSKPAPLEKLDTINSNDLGLQKKKHTTNDISFDDISFDDMSFDDLELFRKKITDNVHKLIESIINNLTRLNSGYGLQVLKYYDSLKHREAATTWTDLKYQYSLCLFATIKSNIEILYYLFQYCVNETKLYKIFKISELTSLAAERQNYIILCQHELISTFVQIVEKLSKFYRSTLSIIDNEKCNNALFTFDLLINNAMIIRDALWNGLYKAQYSLFYTSAYDSSSNIFSILNNFSLNDVKIYNRIECIKAHLSRHRQELLNICLCIVSDAKTIIDEYQTLESNVYSYFKLFNSDYAKFSHCFDNIFAKYHPYTKLREFEQKSEDDIKITPLCDELKVYSYWIVKYFTSGVNDTFFREIVLDNLSNETFKNI